MILSLIFVFAAAVLLVILLSLGLSIAAWLLGALIAGALARFVLPGEQPMSLWQTCVLGLVGSLVSWAACSFAGFTPQGLVAVGCSVAGAVAVLAVVGGLRGAKIICLVGALSMGMSSCALFHAKPQVQEVQNKPAFGTAEEKLDVLQKTLDEARTSGLSAEEKMKLVVEKAKELEALNVDE